MSVSPSVRTAAAAATVGAGSDNRGSAQFNEYRNSVGANPQELARASANRAVTLMPTRGSEDKTISTLKRVERTLGDGRDNREKDGESDQNSGDAQFSGGRVSGRSFHKVA